MTGTNQKTTTTGPHGDTDRRPPRPQTPPSAQPDRRAFDQRGTMYAPTSLSIENNLYIDDTRPMHYNVSAEDSYLVFGDTNQELSLMVSDLALMRLILLAVRALNAIADARGYTVRARREST